MPSSLLQSLAAMHGRKSGSLTHALSFLLERNVVLSDDVRRQRRLLDALTAPTADEAKNAAVSEVVRAFQRERGIGVTGELDAATAASLRLLLPHQVRQWSVTIANLARPSRAEIGRLHKALGQLGFKIADEETRRNSIGPTTTEAIKSFQSREGILVTGTLTRETVGRLSVRVEHGFYSNNKHRTRELQEMLGRLGLQVDKQEASTGSYGPTTIKAVKDFQVRANLPATGFLDDAIVAALRSAALKAQLSTKTQVGYLQRKLIRAIRVAKLSGSIDRTEVKAKTLGPTTMALIEEFQGKFGLPVSGEVDLITMDRLKSVVSSRKAPAPTVTVRSGQELQPLRASLRLNMTNRQVPNMQRALAFAGLHVDKSELKTGTFGRSTREAVLAFQRAQRLPVTGHVDGVTLRQLNAAVASANPVREATQFPYRIRGSVRDESWVGVPKVKVQIVEVGIPGGERLLAERLSRPNGFFDVAYDAPRDAATAQIKDVFRIEVRFTNEAGVRIATKVMASPKQVDWTNVTFGTLPYRGPSLFDARMAAAARILTGANLRFHTSDTTEVNSGTRDALANIQETETVHQVSQLAVDTGLTQDDVMRLVLACRADKHLNDATVNAAVFYIFLAQNMPPSLPSDLLTATSEWELIDHMVDKLVQDIAFIEPSLQAEAFANAAAQNLAPIRTILREDDILEVLAVHARTFALDRPLLAGNGRLRELLGVANVSANFHEKFAMTFARHRALDAGFWDDVEAAPADFGGPDAIKDLRATVEIGQVARNFVPMIAVIRDKINNLADNQLRNARDMAKLSVEEWRIILTENGSQVPPGITEGDPVVTYATTLANGAARAFPDIALIAEVNRSRDHGLGHIAEVSKFVDDNPDLNIKTDNIDAYVASRNLSVNVDVLAETRALQRIHRLTKTEKVGRALLDEKIHHSAGLLALGKERFVEKMAARGVDERNALTTYGYAEFQYAQVLMRITEVRNEMRNSSPSVVNFAPLSAEEQAQLLGNIPNLETLFGPQDYCDCPHCQSVYGPAAYLADILGFLDAKPDQTRTRTVRDVLFDRRPDIGNIKLNCANTDTPLPYIDLVCEVLENAIAAPAPTPNFSAQTTLTAEELRAYPEHQRKEAYEILRAAKFPAAGAFDLWQEEVRAFLSHLGVERHDLMRTFQTDAKPSDTSIAGEQLGLSGLDTQLVTGPALDAGTLETIFGFNPGVARMPLLAFLEASGLTYVEMLDLQIVGWINPPGEADPLKIGTPPGQTGLSVSTIDNITAAKLDRVHRLIRLLRHAQWSIAELDLLLRYVAPDGNLAGEALVRLAAFSRLQKKLSLPVEAALAFYQDINTEPRRSFANDIKRPAPSLYAVIFQNRAVTNPINEQFKLPLPPPATAPDLMPLHAATLMAAFAVSLDDLTQLVALTENGKLTLAGLSTMHRHAVLARSLGVSVEDLITLMAVLKAVTGDPFASPEKTWLFAEKVETLRKLGLDAGELDYLLNHRPASPHGLRDDVITQFGEGLREALRTGIAGQSEGIVVAHLASSFALNNDQARVLYDHLKVAGVSMKTHFTDVRLVARNEVTGSYANNVTDANFPNLFTSYRLLHKIALIAVRAGITAKRLEWLVTTYSARGGLDWTTLPVSAAPAASLTGAWLRLAQWLDFAARFPVPEGASLEAIFDHAEDGPTTAIGTLRKEISALTEWGVEDLKTFDGDAKEGYGAIDTYLKLEERFRQLRRCGISAATAVAWANRDNDGTQFDIANEVRQAAKSKYDPGAWLSKLTPMQDVLREKKRMALVTHLLQNSWRNEDASVSINGVRQRNPKRWHEPDDLLSFYLIDVQMGPLQLTSRIKQAISSCQMFVQRIFLNLDKAYVQVSRAEREDGTSLNSWQQWKWMQRQPIWHSNRMVFLYPENWIEPELRDDKTPFFRDFENTLMQGGVTHESAEAAFAEYIDRVHDVARLDVVGVYHEIDEEVPNSYQPPRVNILHVVGRTKAEPATYFYRTFDLNYDQWSAWEKIDLDITGDHVVPVVYNRRLHLFWLLFTSKPQKLLKVGTAAEVNSGTSGDPPEPPQMLEIQLAWSMRKAGAWTSRSVSPHKLVHPWPRPVSSFNFKPRYKNEKGENLLWLDLFISTSTQFNSRKFYDPFTRKAERLTSNGYDETGRPWHSSSFVFDGQVVDVRLKPIPGKYRFFKSRIRKIGKHWLILGPSWELEDSNSYKYVAANLSLPETRLNPLDQGFMIGPRLVLPLGMRYEYTRLTNSSTNPTSLNVTEYGNTRQVLTNARAPYQLVFSQDYLWFDTGADRLSPLVYQDRQRSFFVRPHRRGGYWDYTEGTGRLKYVFYPFYHPYTGIFRRELGRNGVDGLLTRSIQMAPEKYHPPSHFEFKTVYGTIVGTSVSDRTARTEVVDFERSGAYSAYNWEIFFHMPFLVACRLSQNRRFEEAMRWFHYIFDPTSTDAVESPQRFWITAPFYTQSSNDMRNQRIKELLESISQNLDQVRAWKNNPFKPHVIARYRPAAYQKAVLIKYVENLIAWADQLFRQDTIESINQATTLYVLAYEILGRRPQKTPNLGHKELSYNELVEDGALDAFGNKRVEVLMENFIDPPQFVTATDPGAEPLPTISALYFCIPPNDKILSYWSTIEERLFNIRNSRNIAGVLRQLPLFEPPIDPAILVKAVAAGVDISSVLEDLAAPQLPYRFPTLAAKAAEICNDVRQLGERLLTAIEKRDGEVLSGMRTVHETGILEKIKDIRKKQITDAKLSVETAEKGLDTLQEAIDYYAGIPRTNTWEDLGTIAHGLGIVSEVVSTVLNTVAGAVHLIPDIQAGAAGVGGSPTLTVTISGDQFASSAGKFATMFQGLAAVAHQGGQMLETQGGYTRRHEENQHQLRSARKQYEQQLKVVEGGNVRVALAESELGNLEKQIENSKAVEEYLRTKYSNTQLYDWLLSQLSTVYFQAYQLAFDTAKRAQKSFQVELGQPARTFIQFGYWDSLKKGLLAGDRLLNDIRRMEVAYLEDNRRELELTKHISLAQVAPIELVKLKRNGTCTLRLPEWLFDLDYPGHFFRRVKTVSLSVPSVAGPYTNVNCTLTLTKDRIRMNDSVTGAYGDLLNDADDIRFQKGEPVRKSIATSHAQSDTGMFELNFGDPRFLPFELAGAVGEWTIDLPMASNQFDFSSISDVVLHMRYTARAGGTSLSDQARANVEAVVPQKGAQLLIVNREFASEWQRLFTAPVGEDQELRITLGPEHVPFVARAQAAVANKQIKVKKLDLVLEPAFAQGFEGRYGGPGMATLKPVSGPGDPNGSFKGLPHFEASLAPTLVLFGEWRFSLRKQTAADFRSLKPEDIANAYLVLQYVIE